MTTLLSEHKRLDLPAARDALRLQLAAIAGNEPAESFLEIRCLSPDGKPGPRRFLPIRDHRQVIEVITELRDRYEVLLGAGPRVRRAGTGEAVARLWTLWADIDSETGLERLRRFRPAPSIVVATGGEGHRHAYWPLRAPMPPSWARAANRRLAHALGSDQAATDAARVLRAIGSKNHKYTPAREVRCTRLELDMFTAAEVVGSLADPPSRRPPTSRSRSTTSSSTSSSAVDGLVRLVRDAQPGNRNSALHWAACRVSDRAAQGLLDADVACEALRDAGLAAGLRAHEVDATIASGLGGGEAA